MKNSFNDICSLFGTRFTEQGAICLQEKHHHTQVSLFRHLGGQACVNIYSIRWNEELLTLANFSPCKLLTQLPSAHCSRRSTLFPITHMGIFSSVESYIKTKEIVDASCFFKQSIQHVQHFHSHLNLIHPRSDIKEAAFWSNIVEQQDTVSLTEIGPGNTTKP